MMVVTAFALMGFVLSVAFAMHRIHRGAAARKAIERSETAKRVAMSSLDTSISKLEAYAIALAGEIDDTDHPKKSS
jgi:hypothetical protein